jgi:leucyl-tRNA synthetase
MRDLGLVNSDEPFKNLLCQGMVLADTYYQSDAKGGQRWLSPLEVEPQRDSKGRITTATRKCDGTPVIYNGMGKMSKSKHNGIDPQQMIDQYGADTVRLFMMFAAPPEHSLEWSDTGLEGAQRFIRRFWKQVYQHLQGPAAPALAVDQLTEAQRALRRKTHLTIAKVSDDLERRYTFNTAIAAVMELTNAVNRLQDAQPQSQAVRQEAIRTAVLLLAPITPHLCHGLWRELEPGRNLLQEPWPEVDEQAQVSLMLNMVIQVNGKLRSKLTITADTDRDTIQHLALADPNIQRYLTDRSVRKIIVVSGKLVNIVVA